MRAAKAFYCMCVTVASVFGCVVLMIFSQDSISSPAKSQREVLKWTDTPHSSSPSQPICSANDRAVIPHLSQPFQEFLRYRHCRTYPTLLTPSPCEDDLYLLLAIKSTGINAQRRAAVRDTWGQTGRIQGRRVKLVFLMGRSHDQVLNNKIQPLLEWESRRYGDILQWDFTDIFFNLTLKEVGILRWVSRKCRNAEFVFKGDDDVFVNTENLIVYLKDHKPENHLFAGFIHHPEIPIRDRNSKYFVPVEIYPDGKLYPPFPSGGGYLMSRQTVLSLDVAAQKLELFPLDDVFLGMCLHEIGITLTHHKGFMTFGIPHDQKSDPCLYREFMLVHTLNPVEMQVMSVLMKDKSLSCRYGRS